MAFSITHRFFLNPVEGFFMPRQDFPLGKFQCHVKPSLGAIQVTEAFSGALVRV